MPPWSEVRIDPRHTDTAAPTPLHSPRLRAGDRVEQQAGRQRVHSWHPTRLTLVLGAGGTGKSTLAAHLCAASATTWGRFVLQVEQIAVDDHDPSDPPPRGEQATPARMADSVCLPNAARGAHLILVRRDAPRYTHLALDPAVEVFLFRSMEVSDADLCVLLGVRAEDAALLNAEVRQLPQGTCLHRSASASLNAYGPCTRFVVPAGGVRR